MVKEWTWYQNTPISMWCVGASGYMFVSKVFLMWKSSVVSWNERKKNIQKNDGTR